jgi:hypothetical protein
METKDATHYRHQLIHKQDEVDAANIKLRLLKESTIEQLTTALVPLTERHPPKLDIVEYLLRDLIWKLEQN